MSSLVDSYEGDDIASNLLSQLVVDSKTHEGYCLKKGMLFFVKQKLQLVEFSGITCLLYIMTLTLEGILGFKQHT